MKLSELVNLYNQLCAMDVNHIHSNIARDTNKIAHLVDTNQEVCQVHTSPVHQSISQIMDSVNHFGATVETLKKHLAELILNAEEHWLAEAEKLYRNEMIHDEEEYILNRRVDIPHYEADVLLTRIRSHVDWRFPGLIIRPGLNEFPTTLVDSDPLYIVDQSLEMLSPFLSCFPEMYQNRVCKYVIQDIDNQNILSDIPNGQIGFCIAYNYFHFKPYSIIQQYLREIYSKLREGGSLAITINNCNSVNGVRLVENYYTCYTPVDSLLEFVSEIGYTQTYYKEVGPVIWLELSKPGTLSSIRGGQSLTKILDIVNT